MYRLSEEVVRKLLPNIRMPKISSLETNPFVFEDTKSIGIIDPYGALGTEFDFILEFPYPFINNKLPDVEVLDGYWLYKREELKFLEESYPIPRYLADPNIKNMKQFIEANNCTVILPDEIDKLTCKSIISFEQLIKTIPTILDCLNKELK
jgi:hypothetical protein